MIINILSVKQPWAYLICAGFKRVENRSWQTNYRGMLYIHAGKSFDWNFFWWAKEHKNNAEIMAISRVVVRHFGIVFGDTPEKSSVTEQSEFGAIVGRVELVDIETNAASNWADPGLYHWMVKNPAQIDPIPLRGKLQIFKAYLDDNMMVQHENR